MWGYTLVHTRLAHAAPRTLHTFAADVTPLPGRELVAAVQDLVHDGHGGRVGEGLRAGEQDVEDDAQAPHVHTVVVGAAATVGRADDLRCQVLGRPRHGLAAHVAHHARHAEVGDLGEPPDGRLGLTRHVVHDLLEQDVLRLQVPARPWHSDAAAAVTP